MTRFTVPGAINALNEASAKRWGLMAPVYSYNVRRKNGARIYQVHRIRRDLGPWVPADELWARGDRDHCLAKLLSALNFATSSHD